CEAIVLRVVLGDGPSRAQLQPARGWTDEQWDAAADRLAARGLLDTDGAVTAAGVAAHQAVEEATDNAAARPGDRLGGARPARLAALLAPLAVACAAMLPYPNPVGVPRPAVSPALR